MEELNNGNNLEECNLLFFIFSMQRADKSPDKFEYVLTWKEYQMEYIWGCFQAMIFMKRRDWAESLFSKYSKMIAEEEQKHGMRCNGEELQKEQENTESLWKMNLCRGRAMIAYWIDGNLKEAEDYLVQALKATFPDWESEEWEGMQISLMELENALALVRVWKEQGNDGGKAASAKKLLMRCGQYIHKSVTDKEEHAKIFSKYAWMAAKEQMDMGDPKGALLLCIKAITELGRFGIEYFMIPLLKDMTAYHRRFEGCQESTGNRKDKEKFIEQYKELQRQIGNREIFLSKKRCENYLGVLERLREHFLYKWYPENSLFWNCWQKMYYLDCEIVMKERIALGITQENLADEIYKFEGEIGRFERREVMINNQKYARIMKKLGLPGKKRFNNINTTLQKVLELQRDIQSCAGKHQYDGIKVLLRQMEEKLDMDVMENWRTVRYYYNVIAMNEKSRPYEEILLEDRKLLELTWHIPLETLGEQATLEPKRRRVKNRKGGKSKKPHRKKKTIYRSPMKIEALLLNQIATLLKLLGREEEAKNLYRGVTHMIERSMVRPEYQYRSYSLLLGNMAKTNCSIEDAEKAIKLSLRCGKIGGVGVDYLTIACVMLDDSSNRECCIQMMKDIYCLYELLDDRKNMRILEDYFRGEFGMEINGN
ncbi:MAG: hypothetical protein K2N63_13170 [Lachnospiraceae bacterium]|nr:hypothetical protein [Lachnospiraceae bacterium]